MIHYRYRTKALTGPWRTSPDEAFEDAARAQQVRVEDGPPVRFEWNVPGQIEEIRLDDIRSTH